MEHAAQSSELGPEAWRLPNLHRVHRAGYAVSGAASIHGAEEIPCCPDTGRLTASPFNTAFLPPAPTASDARLQPSARFSGCGGPGICPLSSPWLRTAGRQSPTTEHTTSLSLGDRQGQGKGFLLCFMYFFLIVTDLQYCVSFKAFSSVMKRP